MKGRIGYIDSSRLKMVVAGSLNNAPGNINPLSGAYGIIEHFIGVPTLAAGAPNLASLQSGAWAYMIQNAATLAQADGAGGLATITCGGADNDAGQLIAGFAAAMGAFVPAADKDIWFETRVRSTNLGTAQINLFFGLVRPVAAILLADNGGAIPNQNYLGFVVRDGGAVYSFMGDKAGVQTITASAIALDTNYHTFGFYLKGVSTLIPYIDGTPYPALSPVLATRLPVVGLMPALCIKAGNTFAEVLTPDYIVAVQLS